MLKTEKTQYHKVTDTAIVNSRTSCHTQTRKLKFLKKKKKKTLKLNKTSSYLNELKTYKLGGVEQFQIRFDNIYKIIYIYVYVDISIGKSACVYLYTHNMFRYGE